MICAALQPGYKISEGKFKTLSILQHRLNRNASELAVQCIAWEHEELPVFLRGPELDAMYDSEMLKTNDYKHTFRDKTPLPLTMSPGDLARYRYEPSEADSHPRPIRTTYFKNQRIAIDALAAAMIERYRKTGYATSVAVQKVVRLLRKFGFKKLGYSGLREVRYGINGDPAHPSRGLFEEAVSWSGIDNASRRRATDDIVDALGWYCEQWRLARSMKSRAR